MLAVAVQIVLGWFVADFITALVHITLDKLHGTRAQDWPVVGRMIREFHDHHERPELMPKNGFWESSKETLIASVLAVVFACFGFPWFWGTVALGTGLCQEVHKFAHRQVVPAWARAMQRCQVFISARQHAVHHNGVFDRNFGILNGWSNGLVNFVLWSFGF